MNVCVAGYKRPQYIRRWNFAAFLAQEDVTDASKRLRQSETTGRPLGLESWMDMLTAMTGRELKAKKRGPKIKVREVD